jgi:hypothetical protein
MSSFITAYFGQKAHVFSGHTMRLSVAVRRFAVKPQKFVVDHEISLQKGHVRTSQLHF